MRFRETFLGEAFLSIPEAAPLRALLHRARRGLHVTGKTRDLLSTRLHRITETGGLDRVGQLLSILHTLVRSQDLKNIASPSFRPPENRSDQDRVERVINYIHRNFHDTIDREAVAEHAHLSVSAFSRFFKLRTGKTLKRYVNELRVGRACRLLADERMKITSIALECGFQNLSNFNRRFQEITRLTPSHFRQQLQKSA